MFIIVRPILTDLSQQHFKMYNENVNLSPKSTAEPCYELRETTVKPPKPALKHTGRGGTVGPKAPIVYAVYVRFLNDTLLFGLGNLSEENHMHGGTLLSVFTSKFMRL